MRYVQPQEHSRSVGREVVGTHCPEEYCSFYATSSTDQWKCLSRWMLYFRFTKILQRVENVTFYELVSARLYHESKAKYNDPNPTPNGGSLDKIKGFVSTH